MASYCRLGAAVFEPVFDRKMILITFLLTMMASVNGFQSRLQQTGTRVGTNQRKIDHRPSFDVQDAERQACPSSRFSTQLASTSNPFVSQKYDYNCDVLVLGSGPAARSIASLLGANNLQVVLADQKEERNWAPNYGVWEDEWEAILKKYESMGVKLDGGNEGRCVDRAWPVTDCYFGGSFDIPTENRMRLDRSYYRVDRFALRKSLTNKSYQTIRANHISSAFGVNMYEPTGSLLHDSEGSTIVLAKADGERLTVRSKLIVDCTGHETKLVLREKRDNSPKPGFQIAYGILVDVDEASFQKQKTQIGPYDVEAMTLFDYRTDHYDNTEAGVQEKVEKAPTFMYGTSLMQISVECNGSIALWALPIFLTHFHTISLSHAVERQ